MRDLGITPVEWGRRERYLQIPDVLLIATHARRNAVEEVAGGLVELAELQAPELAGWVTTEAEQFLAALPAPEPEDSDTFLAELRSELPGKWADRAEAIYRRYLNDGNGVTPFAVSPVGPAAVGLANTGREPECVELPGRESDPQILEHTDAAVCDGHRVDRRYDERQQESGGHVLPAEPALDILADTH